MNQHTIDDHKFKFLCKHCKCRKKFVSESRLKKHELCQSTMDYKCKVCGREFPFPSDLTTHEAVNLDEKKFKCSYPRCNREYKTKVEYHRLYKCHQPSVEAHQCPVCNKVFTNKKYLNEHKVHTDELPFQCDICGDHFKWRSGRKMCMDSEHKNKESLGDEF